MLIQLAIMGLLAAMLPLAIVWVSNNPDKYRKLVWVTVFLTFDLIMFGAFTRLTDSGLGCPDWPGCYGHANPLQAHEHISAAEAAMPTGPVTVVKAWIEMIHRYLAMGVGVLIIAIMVIAWRRWLQSRRQALRFSPGLPTMLFVFVCLQGAFGAWTVTLKLQPVIVTIHLMLGMVLLAMLTWLGARQSGDGRAVAINASPLSLSAAAAMVLLAVQVALGGWVSTNYAALACLDFPLCHGKVVPEMDFANGFALWRHLGKTVDGDWLPFPALTAIHWVHRNFAFVVVLFIAWVGYKAMQREATRRTGKRLLILVCLQFITGMSTIFLQWPLALAVIHNGGAAALVLLLTMLNFEVRNSAQGAADRAPTRLSPA
ncbi:MAG TPA: COX15/CtaA family protein [Noviherbaspirillum sp.]|jgi:cytochrome c oxidase assembly protein subunit 15|uniref:COX15/CtaA family protein n=1 Tax=Noviherbaspirillum sp. TaxID=1926288 RepID=UPI002F9344BC